MDAYDLIKEWPSWRNAGAAAVIASPAFSMPMELAGEELRLRPALGPLDDTMELDLRLEETACRLSLADSPLFPDLHRLWQRRDGLPKALLLALVEKECGTLLQSIENALRLQLSVSGIAQASTTPSGNLTAFQLGDDIRFAIELPRTAMASLGRLEHLDTTHPSIRQLSRNAWEEYAAFILTKEEADGLAEGDMLLLEDDFIDRAFWAVQPPADEALHLRSATPSAISFGEFADEALPRIHEPDEAILLLFRRNQLVAEGELSTIGEKKCFKLTRLH